MERRLTGVSEFVPCEYDEVWPMLEVTHHARTLRSSLIKRSNC